MRRADWLVGAIAADETRFRGELPGANVRRGFLYKFLGFVQLLRIAGGHLDLVVLQIVEDQAHWVPFEYFFCGKSIETKL